MTSKFLCSDHLKSLSIVGFEGTPSPTWNLPLSQIYSDKHKCVEMNMKTFYYNSRSFRWRVSFTQLVCEIWKQLLNLKTIRLCSTNISLVAQTVKRLPTMWETWVPSLGREDPLERETATHSSTLAWKIPWMEEPGRLQSMGSRRVGHDWATSLSLYLLTCFMPQTDSKF